MTLTTMNPATSLKPVTEQQLRMFKRTAGSFAEDNTRVATPKEVVAKLKIGFSKELVHSLEEGIEVAKQHNYRMARLHSILRDKVLLEKLKGAFIMVDSKGTVSLFGNGKVEDARYKFNRKRKKLLYDFSGGEDFSKALNPDWINKVSVDTDVPELVKEGKPLLLHVCSYQFSYGYTNLIWGRRLGGYEAQIAYIIEEK